MTIDVAEMALQRIAGSPAQKITIEFQGGEPLMNPSVIDLITEKLKKQADFMMISNASLIL